MPKFKVGQRVKKVRGSHNIGLTGVVIALGDFQEGLYPISENCDIQVQFDTSWVNVANALQPASRAAFALAELFEPIVDDGHLKSSWEEMESILGFDIHPDRTKAKV
jgi:hypothetical protein